jgi:DNA mismatch repair protein MutL
VAPAPAGLKNPERAAGPAVDRPQVTPLISLPLLRVLGQLARSYIIAEGPDGPVLIDQHAAHERIQFEKIKNQRDKQKVEVQGLLEPVTFEVEPKQACGYEWASGGDAGLGFSIEVFGERTFLVRAVPALIRDRDWKAMLRETLDASSREWSENLSAHWPSHSAIRAGQV